MGAPAVGGGGAIVNAAPLAPLAALYGAALAIREALYDKGISGRWRLHRPVVSVGNLTLGGTSKTPLVLWLAEKLRASGVRPGVALRGYGGAYDGVARRVPARVGGGAGAGIFRLYGDEACLIASRLPQVPVAVGRSRAHAALMLVNEEQVHVVLLDDGFQHRSLHRDLDIVLLDRQSPFGNGRLLPAGPLREPPSALRRAHVILLRDSDPGAPVTDSAAAGDRIVAGLSTPGAALHTAGCRLRPAGLRSPEGDEIDPAHPSLQGCIAFCGIARPDSFRAMLRLLGIQPLEFRAFRDHHPFSSLELDDLDAAAARRGAAWLATTEKDAVRLEGWRPRACRLAVLRVALEIDQESSLLERVLRVCRPVAAA